ncbi:MAG: biotin--[Clostridia bacterium]|nr:biotin--[acetyl-CoA-carboxylase] ligase [Clostridia bacterium]
MMSEMYVNGKKIEMPFFDTLPSTNAFLKEKCKNGAPNLYPVVADNQSSGRGRLGRSFHSEIGGLYMSFLLREFGSADMMGITAAAGVSVAEAIEKIYGVSCGIKWVNDLIYNGKKVCGILAEGVISDDGIINGVVVGIGVNITEPTAGFPDEIKDIAGAITDRYSLEKRNELIKAILERFDRNHASSDLIEKYRGRSTVIGKDVRVITPNEAYNAKAIEIDDTFGLVIMTEDGKRKTLRSGEISIRTK